MNYLSDIKKTRERALSEASFDDIEEISFNTETLHLETIVEVELPLYNTPMESPLRFTSPRVYNNYVHFKKKHSR